MQQSKLTNTAYADHLRGCADLAIEIAQRMNIHEDAARQATFATVIINAERHNLFMEPTPRHTKAPVIPPETAAAGLNSEQAKKVEPAAADKDKQAAEKAASQISDVSKVTSPEQDAGARRTNFLSGINSARELLNKEGHVPPITPAGLNAAIAHQFPGKTQLGTLDVDELEQLLMFLSGKLDILRKKKAEAATTEDDDLDF